MIPHERSLVQELKNQKFVLIGVNSDDEDRLKTLIRNKSVTWPCFFDGGDASGPIARRWNVHGWPTIYLIDKNGRIRWKDHHLDAAFIRKLISEN